MCELLRPTRKRARGRFDIESEFPVNRTHQHLSLILRLQCRSLSFIHARGANIHRAVGRVLCRLIDIDDGSDRSVKALVLGQLIRLLCKLKQLIFELTFVIGQRVLVLQERRIGLLQAHTSVLNADDSIIDAGKGFPDQSVIPGVNRSSNQVQCCAQSSNSAGNRLDHKNPPVVDESCVRASDSTTCGDQGDGGGHG